METPSSPQSTPARTLQPTEDSTKTPRASAQTSRAVSMPWWGSQSGCTLPFQPGAPTGPTKGELQVGPATNPSTFASAASLAPSVTEASDAPLVPPVASASLGPICPALAPEPVCMVRLQATKAVKIDSTIGTG